MPTRNDLANAIRALAMDAVEKAKSGHPGAPMGMAEIAETLWNHHMRHNPANPKWPDRDRFVLSNGHGSMLIYALLHLTGYDVSMEDLKQFRQLHSKTPGHPEYGYTPGVETTTGPLGQGITNAVGMAMAEKILAAEFNKPDHEIVNHHTYAFMGDGCMMEGISHESCALAGTWKLNKLIAFWDDNGISIDGHIEHWYTDDTAKRFEAYGWNVIPNVDGHDVVAIEAAIQKAKTSADKPTLICCKTIIGKGSPNKEGTHDVHGAALGHDEVEATRKHIGWNSPAFEVPADIYAGWDAKTKGTGLETLWNNKFAEYRKAYPAEAAEFERRMRGDLPAAYDEAFDAAIDEATARAETIATRKASQNALNHFGPALPELIGGSADLTGSNLTDFKGSGALRVDGTFVPGRHVNFGVREFGMSGILNGLALHGGFVPYGGTFLTFSDYSRNALRMAALMKQRVIFVFTHDSIGLGEDGPTHQAVEHAASLRLIPRLDVWRPCDPVESAVAWGAAIARREGPSALLFSRQAVPFVTRSARQVDAIGRGAYILRDAEEADAVIIATGSEVSLALAARELLAADGIAVRIVSMPSTTVFDRQEASYRRYVLPDHLPRIAVEAGVTDGWWKYRCDAVVGLDTFGESAPAGVLFRLFGFTPENVADTVREALRRRAARA